MGAGVKRPVDARSLVAFALGFVGVVEVAAVDAGWRGRGPVDALLVVVPPPGVRIHCGLKCKLDALVVEAAAMDVGVGVDVGAWVVVLDAMDAGDKDGDIRGYYSSETSLMPFYECSTRLSIKVPKELKVKRLAIHSPPIEISAHRNLISFDSCLTFFIGKEYSKPHFFTPTNTIGSEQ